MARHGRNAHRALQRVLNGGTSAISKAAKPRPAHSALWARWKLAHTQLQLLEQRATERLPQLIQDLLPFWDLLDHTGWVGDVSWIRKRDRHHFPEAAQLNLRLVDGPGDRLVLTKRGELISLTAPATPARWWHRWWPAKYRARPWVPDADHGYSVTEVAVALAWMLDRVEEELVNLEQDTARDLATLA